MKFSNRAAMKAALCSSAAIGLLAASPAFAQSVVLQGDYIKVGVNTRGTLGVGGNTPPGIQYDGTGTGTFNDAYDYLTPGTPFEGFSVRGDGFALSNNNSGYQDVSPISGTLTSYNNVVYNGSTYDQRAVWSGTFGSLFEITNDYHFDDASQKLGITTSIKALTDLTNITFSRVLDPDAFAAPGDSSATNNFIGTTGISGNDLVYAEALVSKYVIGLYSSSSITHNTGISRPWSVAPSTYLSGTNDGNGDYAIGIGFSLGDLIAGRTISFDYSYIFGTDIASAVVPNITGSNTVEDVLAGSVNPVIDGGTLVVDQPADFSQNFSITASNGTIDTAGNDATLSGVISGVGGFTKTGTGTLTLTGENTYSGDTTIAAGTLVGDTDSIKGNVTDNAALEFAQAADGSFGGAITGTGSLTKTGAGTLTLAGANDYTGGTTISAGKLVGDTSSLKGDVMDNAMLEFAQATDGTFAGNVSGSGSVDKSGAGTLRLTGTNAYTGGTNVTGGTLVGDTSSLQGSIANEAAVEFAQTSDGTFGGAITGSGSVTKIGVGTLTLTGANAYSGGTTISGGKLVASTTSLAGNVTNDAALEFAQTVNGTFSGVVSGDGALIKSGAGTLTLSGANTYTGGTTIAAGALVGDTRSLHGDVANNGALAFAQTTDGTFEGAVSGTGALLKAGAGTLTLTGANTYAGGTAITGGTLVGDTTSLQGNVVNGAALVFDQAAGGVYAGTISGTGTFEKTGAGRLNLTGASTYSGATTVDEGRLAVNGSIANSVVTVTNGGQIGGNGTLGGLIVRTRSAATPGNSIGHLSVNGNVLFEAGSFYEVEVDAAGHADLITATGAATIQGGTVQVLAAAGNYMPQTDYLILAANGGVSGQFANVTSNFAFLTPTLRYAANSVTLTMTRNDVTFAQAGRTSNQSAVGGAIDGAFGIGTPIYNALVGASTAGVGYGLNTLSGEIHPAALSMAADDAARLRRSLLSRAQTARPSSATGRNVALWGQLDGSWTNKDGTGNTADVDSSNKGFTVGAEFNPSETFKLGIAGGISDLDVRLGARGSKADVDTTFGAVYASAAFGPATIRGGATYSDLDTRTKRTIAFRSLNETLNASYGGSVAQAFGEVGYAVPLGKGAIEAFGGFNGLWLKDKSFAETGGTAALEGAGRTRAYGWTSLGLRMTVGDAESPVVGRAKLAWEHATSDVNVASRLAFAAGSDSFTVQGAPLSRNSASVEAGAEWRAASALSFSASYVGTLGDRGQDHGGRVAAVIRF